MKKLGPKEICATILVAGIALCLVIYMLVFRKYQEETDALKASNAALQAEVNDLKQYYDNIPLYRKNIEEMRALVTSITTPYPADSKEEDAIMMAVTMQNNAIVNFDSIGIAKPKTIHSVDAEKVKGLNDENLQSQINFNEREVSYSCKTNYAELKNLVATLFDQKNRLGINTISFSKDSEENNYISGVVDVSYYSIDGMNKEYEKPDMSDYVSGTGDFFHATSIDGELIVIGIED